MVLAANASSWTASPARASSIGAATVSLVCATPLRDDVLAAVQRAVVQPDASPSCSDQNTSRPTPSTSGMPGLDEDLRAEVRVAAR